MHWYDKPTATLLPGSLTDPARTGLVATFLARRRFSVIAVVLVLVLAGADTLIIRMAHDAAVEAFRTAINNLCNGMAAQTTRALAAIDAALLEMRDQLTAHATAEQIVARLHARDSVTLLQARGAKLAGIAALAIVGADGMVAATSQASPGIAADVSQQDFFRQLSRADAPDVFVGRPRQPVTGGAWTSVLARRLRDAQGRFAGVVLAEVSLSSLEDLFRTAMPRNRTVTVARSDGMVLVRFPPLDNAAGWQIPQGTGWHAAVAAGGGSMIGPEHFNATAVLAAIRPLPRLPFVVEASVAEADVLADWQLQRIWLVLGGIGACIGVILLTRLFAVQFYRLATTNQQVASANQQLDLALSNMSQGLCSFDRTSRLVFCNRQYGEMYRLPPDAMRPGVTLQEIIDHRYAVCPIAGVSREAYLQTNTAVVQAGAPHRLVMNMVDGRTIVIQHQPTPDGGWVATHEDITERRRAEEQIAFMARHDALTGLANRSLLRERIEEARVGAGRGVSFAVLFLDLDRFKAVNDTLGHAVGDELLKAVAVRLQETTRQSDIVARLGGDEFVILQTGTMVPESAAVLAERIIAVVSEPYQIQGNEVVIGVSIGVDVAGDDSMSADDLLKNADIALYIAKGEGRGTFRFFNPDMDANIQNRHALERDLRGALGRNELALFYQPIVDARTGRTCCFEALLRWHHPERGLIGPQAFISVAEECGLISAIGQWVIEEACREAAKWPESIQVAVNLSPVQFRNGNLVEIVRDALDAAGLPPHRLDLEITESVLLQSNDRNIKVMHRLRALGVSIAMDDFGVGYSSLNYLRSFPFDRIKIDQCFVNDLTARGNAVHFVRAIVGLCRSLGIRTTAEGVETREQLAILMAEGCSDLQGYLFSRPRPATSLTDLIEGTQLLLAAQT